LHTFSTIVDGAGGQKIKQLRAQVEETTSDYDREKLQERLAELAGSPFECSFSKSRTGTVDTLHLPRSVCPPRPRLGWRIIRRRFCEYVAPDIDATKISFQNPQCSGELSL